MSPIQWQCLPFAQLSSNQLYQLLQLRADVFVVEQNCAYQDLDGRDQHPQALHLFNRPTQQEISAYARILPPGLVFEGVAIGRVVVTVNARGQGLGKTLMMEAIAVARKQWGQVAIEISAQVQWLDFYRSLGFMEQGESYLEDNIPHIHMLLEGNG